LSRRRAFCDATADEFLRMMSAHHRAGGLSRFMVTLARQALRLEQQLEQLAFRQMRFGSRKH
jgi:hypothetical protein